MFDKQNYFNNNNYIMAMSDIVTGIDLNYDYYNDKYGDPKKLTSIFELLKDELPFDGVLFAKPNVSKKQEIKIKNAGGFKKYYNIPENIATMGDCGAPKYFDEEVPNLSCEDLLDYYENCGFDFGITLDHIVDTVDLTNRKTPSEKNVFRRQFSIDNAKKMLSIVKEKKLNVYLMGSVQGWSPESYKQSLIELGEAGFKYVAFGGLTKYKKGVIVSIMSYLKPVIQKYNFYCHLLGFGDLPNLGALKKLINVTSIDNTTPLINAANAPIYSWFYKSTGFYSVYLPIFKSSMKSHIKKINSNNNSNTSKIIRGLADGKTSLDLAFEIGTSEDYVNTVAKKFNKRLTNKKLNIEDNLEPKFNELDNFSKIIIKKLIDYDENGNNLNEILTDIKNFEVKYKKLFNVSSQEINNYLRNISKALTSKFWKKCDCKMCRAFSINTQIYRSSQRHKIRAIHNIYHYYKLFNYENNKKNKINRFITY